MLNETIAKFLNISLTQADSLLKIIQYEKHFQKNHEFKDKQFNANEIKTEIEFIEYLQMIGQSHWFKGHDRSLFPSNLDDQVIQTHYFELFKEFGLMDEVKPPNETKPDFLVVLGSSESNVTLRNESLAKYLQAGLLPRSQLIFGLGCNRDLGVAVSETEGSSIAELLEQKKEPIEIEMVSLITQKSIAKFHHLYPRIQLDYQAIEVTSPLKNRSDSTCVKTTDVTLELKRILESDEKWADLPKPLVLCIFSNQPYAERQARDMQAKLGKNYKIIPIGKALDFENYQTHKNSISVALGEIARIINISYCNKEHLKTFSHDLSSDAIKELKKWCAPKEKPTTLSSALQIPHIAHFSKKPENKNNDGAASPHQRVKFPAGLNGI